MSVVELLDYFIVVHEIPLNNLKLSLGKLETFAWLIDVCNILGQLRDELSRLIIEST